MSFPVHSYSGAITKFVVFLKKLKFARIIKLTLVFEKRIFSRQNLSINWFQSVVNYLWSVSLKAILMDRRFIFSDYLFSRSLKTISWIILFSYFCFRHDSLLNLSVHQFFYCKKIAYNQIFYQTIFKIC